jgi:hypothetical protein
MKKMKLLKVIGTCAIAGYCFKKATCKQKNPKSNDFRDIEEHNKTQNDTEPYRVCRRLFI